MKRGEVWWADLGTPPVRQPVLLLSRAEAYDVRSLVTVAQVTTRARRTASEVPLGAADGLPQDCVANLDTIATIPKDCLKSPLAALNAKKIKEIDSAIRFSLGLNLV